MKKLCLITALALAGYACSTVTSDSGRTGHTETGTNLRVQTAIPGSDIWVSAYLASWNHYAPPGGNSGNLPTEEIDWQAFTHLHYFSLRANSDGSLSPIADGNNMNPDRVNAIVTAGHQNSTPVLFSVGGWGNYSGFSGAITSASRPAFISNLVNVLQTWGFDGIDLDMEPIKQSDVENYKAFVQELHANLQSITTPLGSRPLLTVATDWQPEMFAQLNTYFDQINLMTYDMSGAWPGWITWHNAPIHNRGYVFPSTGGPLPSADGKVEEFLMAGVPAHKLGIGIDFYGYVWSGGVGTSTGGVTEPRQSWTTAPIVEDNVPYHTLMDMYYQPGLYHWDNVALAAYLSIDNAGSSQDKFISYDNEQTVDSKISYIRSKSIGGTIIWELGGGFRNNQPAGQRDPLLQAVKQAVDAGLSPSPTPPGSTEGLVYDDALQNPWINASWSATIDFSSAERIYAGQRSVKVIQNAWGSLSLHNGDWSNSVDITPGQYERIDFAIYGLNQDLIIDVMLENDQGYSFPRVRYGTVTANQWTVVSIPMSQLNPDNQIVHRVDLLEVSGQKRTYYVDNVQFFTSPAL